MNNRYKDFHNFELMHHADEVHSADYYVGSRLTAKQTVGVWSGPSLQSTLLKTIKPGGYVGTIYSYITGNNGELWWMLEGGGYALHGVGKFDLTDATNTSPQYQADQQKAAEQANDVFTIAENAGKKVIKGAGDLVGGAGDFLSGLGDNLKWIAIAVAVAGTIYLVMKFRS